MEVEIKVVAWSDVDIWDRYHGLAIDQPLNADFWKSQPEKIAGRTWMRKTRFTYTKTVDLEPGKHYVIYGNSATEDMVWIAEIYINNKLMGRKDDIYRGNFLRVDFNVGAPGGPGGPVEWGEYIIPIVAGGAVVAVIGGVIAYNEFGRGVR